MDSFAILIYLVAGITLGGFIFRKPQWFRILLVFTTAFSAGLMVRGYCLVDEFLVGCIVVGFLAAIWKRKITAVSAKKQLHWPEKLHAGLFSIMCVYMIAESIRGMVVLNDPRMCRWVFYYALLWVIPFLSGSRFQANSEDDGKTIFAALLGTAAYFTLYISFGLINEAFGYNRFTSQGSWWSGSAYAMFPLVIAIPAAMFFIDTRYRGASFFTFALVLINSFYYDSRVGLLAVLLFLAVSLSFLKFKHILSLTALFAALWLFFNFSPQINSILMKTKAYGTMVLGAERALSDPRDSDRDRWIHLKAASTMLSDAKTTGWFVTLFGQGIYVHRQTFGSQLKPLYNKYLPNCKLGNITRTEALSALIVDTGFLGLALIFFNTLICFYYAFAFCSFKLRTGLYTIIATLVVIFLWMTISNTLDIVLFYLMIMPSGLIAALSRMNWKKNSCSFV